MLIKKTFTMLAAGLLMVALGGVAAAQRPFARMANLKTYLALTDQQFSDISGMLRKHQDAAFPLRQELRAKTHELKNALGAPEPNPTVLGQLILAQQALKTQLRAFNLKLRADIAARLNPEQRQKFDSLRNRPSRRVRQP